MVTNVWGFPRKFFMVVIYLLFGPELIATFKKLEEIFVFNRGCNIEVTEVLNSANAEV